jgi:Protein of unknown function (DUF3325)
MLSIVLFTQILALLGLSLAKQREGKLILDQAPVGSLARSLRVAGWGLLLLSLWLLWGSPSTSVGLTLWFGLLSVAALLVCLAYTYVPGLLRRLCRVIARYTSPPA